jgi:glycosyltransferase involved in cell wall biosynthesis
MIDSELITISSDRLMLTTPHVSVIMPAYNAARYIDEAVSSILNQTYRDFEFIIIDDGSTDGTREKLQGYAAIDPRIILRSRPNTGLTIALREAIELAQGEFIARMDADDISIPTRFEKQLHFLQSNPDHALVGSSVLFIDKDSLPLGVSPWPVGSHEIIDSWHMSGRGSILMHPSSMFRRSVYDAVGGYRIEYEVAQDLDLWLRIAEVGRIHVLSDYLLQFRIHQESISRQKSHRQDRALWQGVMDAHRRRNTNLKSVPFVELSNEDQQTWIDNALSNIYWSASLRWSFYRLKQIQNWRSLKNFIKAICCPILPILTPTIRWLRS